MDKKRSKSYAIEDPEMNYFRDELIWSIKEDWNKKNIDPDLVKSCAFPKLAYWVDEYFENERRKFLNPKQK